MKKLNAQSSVVKIDEYLREFGYTVCEAWDELKYTLYQETQAGWKPAKTFTTKEQLLIFAGELK